MEKTLRKTGESFREVYQRFLPLVYRIAYTYLKNPQDSEDAAQETFLRLFRQEKPFHSMEHCKAWLIVTVGNVCKDMLRRASRRDLPLEEYHSVSPGPEPDGGLISAILDLPEKYRSTLYLYYYEGYSVKETAILLKQPPETVKTWLRRAREKLKERLGESFDA